LTGSPPIVNTIGVEIVAACAARADETSPVAAMAATLAAFSLREQRPPFSWTKPIR
jgi:hypothetical protein